MLNRRRSTIRQENIARTRHVAIPRGNKVGNIISELAYPLRIGICAGSRRAYRRPHLLGALDHVGGERGRDAGVADSELVGQIA